MKAKNWKRNLLLVSLLVVVSIVVWKLFFFNPLSPQQLKALTSSWEKLSSPGKFIMSLARSSDGKVWVGTEGQGVWRFDSKATPGGQWTQFTTADGLGDDYAYSVAVDKRGRVWVGHLNHGVSVFNGISWENYDVPFGPIGGHIFKIAVCPQDGDVWMGSSAGLTRYSAGDNTWTHFTKAAGLPSDQVNAITFDAHGNIYIGTQCDGIAVASRKQNYRDWKNASMSEPTNSAADGSGLPSMLINALATAPDGTVYAATDGGLAWTRDGGANWHFRRGLDFFTNTPGSAAAGNIPSGSTLPDGHVTSLAVDEAGVVWLGIRDKGLMALNGKSQQELLTLPPRQAGGADDATVILPMPDYHPFFVNYCSGLFRASGKTKLVLNFHFHGHSETGAGFPSAAKEPNLAELNALLKEIQSVPPAEFTNGTVLALEDDWLTEGQWQGRYGKFWIVLCGNWSQAFTGHYVQMDDVWGAGWDVMYDTRIGPNHSPGDSLRYWIQWLATTNNRSLEMSPTYLDSRVRRKLTTWDVDRRESEWNDDGMVYPMSQDGPNIYCSLSIPAGLFYLSLYDNNKDGHDGNNRFRDCTISVRPHPGRTSLDEHHGNTTVMRSFFDIEEFDQKPELAHSRIVDFWGGVYKRFLVRGPAKLTIQVNRNHSFNSMLNGVMLDLVDELPPPYFQTREAWEQAQAQQKGTNTFEAATDESTAAQQLAAGLKAVSFSNPAWWAENKRRFCLPLLRWQLADNSTNNSSALATSFYQLNLFASWEKQLKAQGLTPAREIEKALRWDGVMYSCAGMGNQIVRDYLKSHPEINGQH